MTELLAELMRLRRKLAAKVASLRETGAITNRIVAGSVDSVSRDGPEREIRVGNAIPESEEEPEATHDMLTNSRRKAGFRR